MKVVFTKHACQRVKERFSHQLEREIPFEQIIKVGAITCDGMRFTVIFDQVRYACQRHEDLIKALTVFPAFRRKRKNKTKFRR